METIVADKVYTAADYEELPEGVPYQLTDANLIHMPSPTMPLSFLPLMKRLVS